ncbi:MAG TPA: histidinol dehydrogenase [Gemmatimonadaceae bacterium]|nr:histidinol dehydrogenase [Gemmatimonadaceae bacterium]
MSALTIAVRGDVDTLDATTRRALFARDSRCDAPRGVPRAATENSSPDSTIRDRTAEIMQRVRERGDDALRAFAIEYDGVGGGGDSLDGAERDSLRADRAPGDDPRGWSLEVPRAECDAALAALDPALRRVMQRAADNIRAVHEAFRPLASEFVTADGVRIGRRPDALQRVGVYAPGGRAAYPSSLLMGAIPARVAGVSEIIVCSPPASDGRPSPVVLAAAALAGADRLFAVGGAGAVAAMAYGTPTIPSVDRIVGPGNAFVAEAKRQVSHEVGIDSPAGPSELLVLADDSAEPLLVAREMLAQAEHDPRAAVVLVTTSRALARDVESKLASGMGDAARASTMCAALGSRGAILTATSLEAAIAFASQWAPEHLLLLVAPAARERALVALRGCGTILHGDGASVVFGDYMTGANHVLPTGGAGRAWSGLSTQDFVRWTTWQRVDRPAAARMAHDTAVFATAEGLDAHARAAAAWEAR